MKYHSLIIILLLTIMMGCRSEADRLTEFCIHFDKEVQASSDCHDMSMRLGELLSPPQPHFRDTDLCEDTEACLPCRKAVREMLKQCGYDPELRPILDQMTFSKTLRKQMVSEED